MAVAGGMPAGAAAERSPNARTSTQEPAVPSLSGEPREGNSHLLHRSHQVFLQALCRTPCPPPTTKAVYTRKLHYENVEVGHPQITALTFRYNGLRRVGQIKDGVEMVPPKLRKKKPKPK